MARMVPRRKRAGTVADLEGRDDLVLVTDSQEIEALRENFGNPDWWDYDGCFVEVDEGDYDDVYCFHGVVARHEKEIDKIAIDPHSYTVESEVYRPSPDTHPNWFEYRVMLLCDGQPIDRWDSAMETYNGIQKLSRGQAERAIREIEEDVEQEGNVDEWFSHVPFG